MTTKEFNEKWKDHLEPRHYGMAIGIPEVIEYMDREFEKEKQVNPDFTYSQIKTKFGTARVYTSSDKASEWEGYIDGILSND
jgi:hypothetical protein